MPTDKPTELTPTWTPAALSEKDQQWFNSSWRPAMAWQYLAVCLFDFLLGPIGNAIFFGISPARAFVEWHPLTVQGGGIYHLAMGAVIGVVAWSRGQEKLKLMDYAGGGTETTTSVTTSTAVKPPAAPTPNVPPPPPPPPAG